MHPPCDYRERAPPKLLVKIRDATVIRHLKSLTDLEKVDEFNARLAKYGRHPPEVSVKTRELWKRPKVTAIHQLKSGDIE